MRKTGMGTRFNLKIIVISVALSFLIVGGFMLLQKWEENKSRFPEQDIEVQTLTYEGREYTLKNNVETFLVIGLDKYDGEYVDSYNNDKHADFLMLFVFDNDAKQCTAVHINRDSIVDVNVLGVAGNKIDVVKKQIALAHTYGNGKDVSCRNVSDSVSSMLLETKINHYLSLTMDAVIILNDLLGGVDVFVLDDFNGIDDTLVQGETVTLMGEQALRYVRARHGLDDSTNNARMKRQQQYINSFYVKFQNRIATDEEFIADAALQLSEHIVSDRSVTQLQSLAEKFNEYEFLGIRDIDGAFQNGAEYVEFYPDENSVKALVIDLFYELKK